MFTIIIPTLERHNVLLRSIDYYQHFNCNVFIADASARKINCEFPDNVIYKHLPGSSYGKRILETAKDVTTPYACLGPDDDYFLESGLKAGARFLDDHLDYVSVQGIYLGFKLIKNQVVFSPRYSRDASHYAVEAEDSFSRIVRAFNPHMHQLYSIHRTDLLIKSLQLSANISNPQIVEYTQPLVPMCYGKHKVLPILWMARDMYTFDPVRRQRNLTEKLKVGSVTSHYRRYNQVVNKIEDFLDSEECGLVKKKFRGVISKLVKDNKESDKLFRAAFNSLIKDYISSRNRVIIKKIIKSFAPTWVLNYYINSRTLQHMSGIETTSSTEDALNKIRLSVLTFRKCYDR